MPDQRLAPRSLIAGGLAFFVAVAAGHAQAQTRLDSTYSVTAARIPIGSVTASVEIGDAEFAILMRGRIGAALRVLSAGEGSFNARGTIADGSPLPGEFSAKASSDEENLDAKITFADGSVKDLTVSPPPPAADRIPLTDAHRQNVVDPLTALLIPLAEGADKPTASICQRTLPIFDGRRRFDLKFAFARMEDVKTDKGYAGPTVVCSVTFVPIAGYRASNPLVKFLTEGRQIEMSFAPIAGTRFMAPFRISVISMLGNLVIAAKSFEIAPAPRASAAPSP